MCHLVMFFLVTIDDHDDRKDDQTTEKIAAEIYHHIIEFARAIRREMLDDFG